MIDQVVSTAYGRQANVALASAVARGKSRPLDPITVIVPSNFAGLSARRILGGSALDSNGLVNVNFVTPFRLAELLAAGQLVDRRPLTNPVLGAAVRRALVEDPRHFAPVADHQATEAALASLTGELSNVSERALGRIETLGGPSAASSIAFFRLITSYLTDFHDEADVARAAAKRGDLVNALAPLGHLVWHLPGPTTRPLTDFLRAVFALAPSTVILGLSGAADADDVVFATLAAAGIPRSEVVVPPDLATGPPHASTIVSVTDADEEVRAVIRQIVALAEAGTPLDRIGVFHPTPDPYVRILEQQLGSAALPANGPSRRRLSESVAGRTVLGALALPGQRWRRDRVMAVVNAGPLRQDDARVRPGAWETLSRQAGVVQDLTDWRAKLDIRERALGHQRVDADEAGHERLAERLGREADDVRQLAAFVVSLSEHVGAVDRATSWGEKTAAALAMLRTLLGAAHTHSSWPESEQVAFERVETALERLAALDEIETAPTHAVFMRALASELDVARGRSGRFGDGITYGPLSSAIGHDLDAVFILGCAEGLCPAARRDDAMLPDAARSLADGELDLRLEQLGEQHRHFLAALASAPSGARTLVFARGDLRGGRRSRPSRWLLASASELAGHPIYATDFDDDTPPVVAEVASFASGLLATPTFASLEERDLAAVRRVELSGGKTAAHPAVQSIGRGLTAQALRAGSEFTEWDGNVAGQPIPSTDERPLSPTRLQNWAACGFRYFLAYVLELDDRDDPERTVDISPLDRGSGVHEVLERFFLEVLADGPPAPNEPWTDAHRSRVRELAIEVFDAYEARGRTGRPVRWKITKSDLLALLDEFLDADNLHRSKTQSTPERVELPFGIDGTEPLVLDLGDGRTLQFRGKADRVDRTADGRRFVSDYKTGKGKEYKGIEKGDPVKGGKTLQLGLYAEAARQHLGAKDVDAHYWMVNTAAGHRRMGYPWTDERSERMRSVLGTIAGGIEGGMFAAVPGDWDSFRGTHKSCTFCPFDSVCPSSRGEQALAKLATPELRLRDGLDFEESE